MRPVSHRPDGHHTGAVSREGPHSGQAAVGDDDVHDLLGIRRAGIRHGKRTRSAAWPGTASATTGRAGCRFPRPRSRTVASCWPSLPWSRRTGTSLTGCLKAWDGLSAWTRHGASAGGVLSDGKLADHSPNRPRANFAPPAATRPGQPRPPGRGTSGLRGGAREPALLPFAQQPALPRGVTDNLARHR
jgi:hypothetical protein